MQKDLLLFYWAKRLEEEKAKSQLALSLLAFCLQAQKLRNGVSHRNLETA